MAQRLRTMAEKFQPDVIQFHNLAGITRSVWSVPGELDIASVQVLHDLNIICPNSSMFKDGKPCARQCWSCKIFRYDSPRLSRPIDAVVGVSQFVLDKIVDEQCFQLSECHVIYNAQDLPSPFPLPNGAEVIFGYVGALSPSKGVEWLINEFDNAYGRLEIAGTGAASYVNHLSKLAEGKKVRFVGHVNPISFFRSVHVGVVPSLWNEALGGVAIEAGSVGRPVIASRRGGLPEVVREGETGFLVDPSRPGSLGLAMQAIADDSVLLKSFAKAAPLGVRKFTDLSRFFDDYENLWRKLIN